MIWKAKSYYIISYLCFLSNNKILNKCNTLYLKKKTRLSLLILELDFNYLDVLHLIPPKNRNQDIIEELLLSIKYGVNNKQVQYKLI